MLDAFARDDDPGLTLDRLAAGGAIDLQLRRRKSWPDRMSRWIWFWFWVMLGLAVVADIWAVP